MLRPHWGRFVHAVAGLPLLVAAKPTNNPMLILAGGSSSTNNFDDDFDFDDEIPGVAIAIDQQRAEEKLRPELQQYVLKTNKHTNKQTNLAQKLDLRCILLPSTFGAVAKTISNPA